MAQPSKPKATAAKKAKASPGGESKPASKAGARSRFQPVTVPLRAFEQVSAQIRRMLADGSLKPGDKLPAERDLAEDLHVSRGVVREALRTLEIAGLLELRKGGTGGAFVVSEQYRIVTQAFKDMVYLGSISLAELIEARVKFLGTAIELACERGEDADFDALQDNIDRTQAEYEQDRNAFSTARRLQLAVEFYHLLGAASKNQVISLSVDTVSQMLLQFFRPRTSTPTLQLVASRRRFLTHLRARNAAKATKEMTAFTTALQQYMLVLESMPEVRPTRSSA